MFKKKLLLVPLMLLAAVGSIQAAAAPMIPLVNNGWDYSVSDGKIVWIDATTSTLKWGSAKGDVDLSWIRFDVADSQALPLVGKSGDVSLGTLYYHNGKMPAGDKSTLLATLKFALGSDMPIDFEIMNRFKVIKGISSDQDRPDLFSISELPLDKEYIFELDKQKYSMSLKGFFDGDTERSDFLCDEGGDIKWDLKATVTNVTPSSVPIPATAWLLGSGLLGLLGFRRRQTV